MLVQITKDKLIKDFKLMKEFETSARDFYLKVCADPSLEKEQVRQVFKEVATDEEQHIKIVQEIIALIESIKQ